MTDSADRKPFAGVRVLDFTRYLVGPFGTYQLALLGVEVIKVEPPGGEEMRHTQVSRADAATWEARLTAADVPCARIRTIAEITEHPQLAHREALQRIDTEWGPLTLVGSGFRLAAGGGGLSRAAPRLGADAGQILREAGYDDAEIDRLRREKVVCADNMAQD